MEPLMHIPDDANTGIRRCPNCCTRENGKTLLCMHCYWKDGTLSRFTGECELRRWAEELQAAGVIAPNKAQRLADCIKDEREKINSLISDWHAGTIVVPRKDEYDDRSGLGRDGRLDAAASEGPQLPTDTQCGC